MIVQDLKNYLHLIESLTANIVYSFPSRKIKVIGVTGTDGKTTVSHLIHHILKTSGRKTSLISSVQAVIAGRVFETGFHTTTPRAWKVQKYLKEAILAGDEYFVLETTSHALDQNRVWGVRYEISVITNVAHEHLYHHKTFNEYLKAKAKIALQSHLTLLNRDDPSTDSIIRIIKSRPFRTFGIESKVDFGWDGKITTHLKGGYNRSNILAAYATCVLFGLPKEQIRRGIKTFTLPKGRLDVVYDRDFTVMIDFAHTPQSISSVLETVKDHFVKKDGKIIHIFGAASERDDSKRPLMGEASAAYSDLVILTEEDYRREDVRDICRQIARGLEKKGFNKVERAEFTKPKALRRYTIVPDRAEAIKLGISCAKTGDVVIVTGKGHEKSLNRGGREYPWDEYKAVNQALKIINY